MRQNLPGGKYLLLIYSNEARSGLHDREAKLHGDVVSIDRGVLELLSRRRDHERDGPSELLHAHVPIAIPVDRRCPERIDDRLGEVSVPDRVRLIGILAPP